TDFRFLISTTLSSPSASDLVKAVCTPRRYFELSTWDRVCSGWFFKSQPQRHAKRMLLFVGGRLNSSKADMEGLGRFLKDKDIAVDVVWFRDTHRIRNEVKKERLEAFVAAVNNNNTSHIAYLEDGYEESSTERARTRILHPALRTSMPIYLSTEEDTRARD
ncbi:26S proteasome non-ATPase regulatory subunit 4, partial [Tanacetum coccineum]